MTVKPEDMVARVSDHLARAKCNPGVTASGLKADCPVCRKRSITLSRRYDAVVNCRSGCAPGEILKAIGLRMEDVRIPMTGADGAAPSSAPAVPGTSRVAPASDVAVREKELATVVCVADVKRERVEWLWQNRIPFGKLTVIDGDPGLGKSTLTLDIAARVSTGRPLPGGTEPCSAMGVVLVSLEDGVGDTIRPRLEAAGADLNRVHAITGIGKHHRTPTVPDDVAEIERVAVECGARLVIFDPFMAVLSGKVNAHRDQDVRRALAPLAAMAERIGAAVVVVRHLNKADDKTAVYRGGGSIGIIGAARSGLLVAADPDNPDLRVLAPTKSNLGPSAKALRFSLVESPEHGCAVVAWGEACSLTADQLLARPDRAEAADQQGALAEAVAFLREELAGGPRPVTDLQTQAKASGVNWRSVQRASVRLGVEKRKAGFGEGWAWSLKDAKAEGLAPFAKAAKTDGAQPSGTTPKNAKAPEERQAHSLADLDESAESGESGESAEPWWPAEPEESTDSGEPPAGPLQTAAKRGAP